MLPKGIADFIASCGLEAKDLPAPDKLILSRRLLGAQRRRCGNQCKGGRGEQCLVHGNLRGLRQSIVSCRNPQTLAACRTASATCDATHPSALLRARRERPRDCCAAEQRGEVAPLHSITSSARPESGSGTVMPSALAVLRLMKSSTLVACWTGRSAGLSPLRIRPV